MSITYNGEHSITFISLDGLTEQNTWSQWSLIPKTRPVMSIPSAHNRFVEIPGMDGSYDLSDYLTPDITYSDRSGSFEFIVDRNKMSWLSAYSTIVNFLHGQRLRMILSDDPSWYYEGRFSVDQFQSDQAYSRIVISYRVYPYKLSMNSGFMENVLWDPFNFETDYDWSCLWHVQSTNSTKTYNFKPNGISFTIIARLVSGGPVTASFGGVTKILNTVNKIEDLGKMSLTRTRSLTLNGSGVVDVGWRPHAL